jgi:hypothetical protein
LRTESFSNLEPNHVLRDEIDTLVVECPFVNPDTGWGFETPWSPRADPSEVSCLFCEYLNGALHLLGPPVHDAEPNDG